MKFCDQCRKEVKETFDCEICGGHFCEDHISISRDDTRNIITESICECCKNDSEEEE